MFLLIEDLLSAAEVAAVTKLAQQARFVDGRTTNPHNVTKVNVVADASSAAAQQASQIAFTALQRSEQALNFARSTLGDSHRGGMIRQSLKQMFAAGRR